MSNGNPVKGNWMGIKALAGLSATACASLLAGPHWWAVVLAVGLVVLTLVVPVCWLATRSNSGRVSSPLLSWERSLHSGDEPNLGEGDVKEDDQSDLPSPP